MVLPECVTGDHNADAHYRKNRHKAANSRRPSRESVSKTAKTREQQQRNDQETGAHQSLEQNQGSDVTTGRLQTFSDARLNTVSSPMWSSTHAISRGSHILRSAQLALKQWPPRPGDRGRVNRLHRRAIVTSERPCLRRLRQGLRASPCRPFGRRGADARCSPHVDTPQWGWHPSAQGEVTCGLDRAMVAAH